MKRLLVVAAALVAVACQPIPPKGTIDTTDVPPAVQVSESPAAADCVRRGGTMQPVGRLQTMQCVVRYADAGKRCTDGDQCAGECRVADVAARPAEGASVAGRCQADSNRFGCFTRVEDGKAEATLCVD
jgi:putative hemolysin